MPEGAEVRIIADQLKKKLVGRTLYYTQVIGGRYQKPILSRTLLEGYEATKKTLPGWKDASLAFPIKILDIASKGKFIYWTLEKEWYLWNTLGMTGEWSLEQTKHSSVLMNIRLKKEIGWTEHFDIFFNDIRHFGTLKFVKGQKEMAAKLRSIGPDMLLNPPSVKDFSRIIKARGERTLAESLMDQRVISGVGNYVKAEALYRCKLSPWRQSNILSDKETSALHKAIVQVLKESYDHGGTTLRNYRDTEGKEGSFSDLLVVYGKEKDPAGRLVSKETTADKRTTWWVPEVQK